MFNRVISILKEARPMRLVLAMLLAVLGFVAPTTALHAQSADVEATITKVDTKQLTIALDDGKTYQVPEEFNFEGLKPGVKVVVYYTEVKGRRVVDDLQTTE